MVFSREKLSESYLNSLNYTSGTFKGTAQQASSEIIEADFQKRVAPLLTPCREVCSNKT